MSRQSISRDQENDYSFQASKTRREFLTENSGTVLDQVAAFSFDQETPLGNTENFIGAAQVPIGISGPLLIKGEHATGEFYFLLATTEGALVASYNRHHLPRSHATLPRIPLRQRTCGKVQGITQFAVGPNLYLRFDYSTGDAAGQNMVSKATLAACLWMKES